jgi:hypothetical protein
LKIDKRRLNDTDVTNAKDFGYYCVIQAKNFRFYAFYKRNDSLWEEQRGCFNRFIEFTSYEDRCTIDRSTHPKVIEIFEQRNGDFPKAWTRNIIYLLQICRIAKIDQR